MLFYDVSLLAENRADRSEAFVRLLRLLRELASLLLKAGRDPTPSLVNGLPAVARGGADRSWVLEEALESAVRLTKSGLDPGPYLTHAVDALAAVAGVEHPACRQLSRVTEGRAPDIAEDSWPAVRAAAMVCGGSAQRLDEALCAALNFISGAIGSANDRATSITALPQLAATARDVEGLVSVMSAFRSEMTSFAAHAEAERAWLDYGIESCVSVAPGNHETAAALLAGLGRLCREWGAFAAAILHYGGRPAAAIAGCQPALFLEAIARWAKAAVRLREIGMELQQALPRVAAVARAAERSRKGGWEEALELQCDVLAAAGPAPVRVLDDLAYAEQVIDRWTDAWGLLVAPVLRTHGRYAGDLLYVLASVPRNLVRLDTDLEVIRNLATQSGVRALDVVHNLIIPAFDRGIISSLTDHRNSLRGFMREVACSDVDLYASYSRIVNDGTLAQMERRRQVGALRDRFAALAAAIRTSDLTDEQVSDPHFFPAMAYVFPPSFTVTRQSYEELFTLKSDRPQDTSDRDPGPDLRSRSYALRRGSWQLCPEATLDRAVWEPLLTALRNAFETEDAAELLPKLGWELLRLWSEGRLGQAKVKAAMWSRLLRIVGAADALLPQEAASAAQLLDIRRAFADRLRDAVEETLLASRQENIARYDRIVREKMTPAVRIGSALVKGVLNQLGSLRSGHIDAEEAAQRLVRLLSAFALEENTILEVLGRADSPDEIRKIIGQAGLRRIELIPGREVMRVHGELAGQEVAAIGRELFGSVGRGGVLEYREASEKLELACEVTKRRAHAAVGFSEGVCVATDVTLWNNPDFLQVVFWDSAGICRGGMHLLIVEQGAGRYLALPGINPCSQLLEMVDAPAVLDMALDYARRLSKTWGLEGIWIPIDTCIHSNRQTIREAIAECRWETRSVGGITFSYSPYAYSFSEVFEVPEAGPKSSE